MVVSAGVVKVGAIVSLTVMICEPEAEFPQVMICEPEAEFPQPSVSVHILVITFSPSQLPGTVSLSAKVASRPVVKVGAIVSLTVVE